MKQGILTRCELSFPGYLIAWRGDDEMHWRAILAKVRDLPARDRFYVADEKAWHVSRVGLDRIGHYFGNIVEARRYAETGEASYEQEIPRAVADAFARLHLSLDAPPDVIAVVYRHLAKSGHPDAGGDTGAMKAINNARDVAMAWAENMRRSA